MYSGIESTEPIRKLELENDALRESISQQNSLNNQLGNYYKTDLDNVNTINKYLLIVYYVLAAALIILTIFIAMRRNPGTIFEVMYQLFSIKKICTLIFVMIFPFILSLVMICMAYS